MVKCADCGFLAIREERTRALEYADEAFRDRDEARRVGYLKGGFEEPVCFLAKAKLGHEREAYLQQQPLREAERDSMGGVTNEREVRMAAHQSIVEVTGADRLCDGFAQLVPGFTPKEHKEMVDRQWMLEREDRRDRQARICVGLNSV